MNTCVIIPTYNEAKEIGRLVSEIKLLGQEVVVIDDGSSDNTAQIARKNGAVVFENPHNRGKGASLIKGFCYAAEKQFDAVVTIDGDGQHLTQDIPYFMNVAKYSQSGIIIGNRMKKTKNMPMLRFLTNKFMSWLISKIARQKIPDTQCGFRLIKKEVFDKIRLCTSKYETESELLIKGARAGFKIESIPIKSIYRQERSYINPLIDTVRFIRMVIGELWTSRR
ncbi:MAG: glycosyltransferase family 2 protein [Candidatus Omnitrophota bacterium]